MILSSFLILTNTTLTSGRCEYMLACVHTLVTTSTSLPHDALQISPDADGCIGDGKRVQDPEL